MFKAIFKMEKASFNAKKNRSTTPKGVERERESERKKERERMKERERNTHRTRRERMRRRHVTDITKNLKCAREKNMVEKLKTRKNLKNLE